MSQIIETTPTTTAIVPRTIPVRRLVSRGTPRGHFQGLHLEDVRDEIVRRRALQEPRDLEMSPRMFHLHFGDGVERTTLRQLAPNGLGDARYYITDHALRQLATVVLPAHGLGVLDALADRGDPGRKLADLTWAVFAAGSDQPRNFRTILQRVNGDTPRVVRACVSQKYAVYDNVDAVTDLLNAGLDYLPVLSYDETDTGLRLRFSLSPEGQIEVRKPIPMIEVWNSEVGLRAMQLTAGIYQLVCTNGMGSWEGRQAWRWIHSGSRERIQAGLEGAVHEARTVASGVIDAYQRAVDVAIDDAYAWMERELTGDGGLSKERLEKARAALDNETTTPGHGLASVVDAITLIAQDETDLYASEGVERIAARALRLGLSQQRDGRLTAAI